MWNNGILVAVEQVKDGFEKLDVDFMSNEIYRCEIEWDLRGVKRVRDQFEGLELV